MTYSDLYDAVRDDYSDPTGIIYLTYGPVEEWCFDPGLTAFRFLFDSTSFNEDISGWDVSSGTDFRGMFLWNPAFNQDISGWDVSQGHDFGVSKASTKLLQLRPRSFHV